MQNKHFFIFLSFFLFFLSQKVIAQKNYVISGYVEDAASGERLIGAAVFDSTAQTGTVSNNYGYFNLSIPSKPLNTEGVTYLRISYIGYQTERITINIRGDTTLNIKLSTKNTLQAVEVNAQKENRIEDRVQMSQVTIPIEQIKRMPMILGEADVLKSLQFLPGVKAGTEGTAGIQVRGGSQDQNLFLLDGVPIYNPTHFGGFFSVFNADALKSVNLIKGGFPARFGGRLSSVVEVDTKDGDKKKFHATGAIGLLMSKLTLEGPILKDKISYMISARRTYIDLPLSGTFNTKTTSGGTTEEKNTDLFFYDINAKFNARIDDKNQLFLSLYQGYDVYAESNSFTGTFDSKPAYRKNGFDLNFKNQIASLRWNKLFNNRLFSNTTLYFTRYNLNYNDFNEFKFDPSPLQNQSTNFNTRIEDVALKSDVDYVLNNQQKLKFGFNIIRHGFLPNRITTQITGQRDTTYNDNKEFSLENDVYGEYHYAYKRFDANAGLRVSYFDAKNKGYFALQPRLNLSFKISDNAAIKGSFSSNAQFIHSLTNDALGFPTDSWIPSVQGIRPAQSNQIALGFAKTVWKDYELSIESYYKTMDNLVAYREGDSYLNPDPVWERKVVQGKGKSYGLEMLLQKKEGRLSGWVSYTLAKSTRQFEDINDSEEYPFKYDRRHEFSIVAMWKLSPNISISANWFFATGNAITLPSGVYNIPFNSFPYGSVDVSRVIDYGVRNGYRTVPSHRLDIGIEFYKKKRKYERKWQFGIYNVYNRGNPFFFQFDILPEGTYRPVKIGNIEYARLIETYKLRQINLIPILPYLSYEIKF